MTKPPEPVVTGELKPCPFCGGSKAFVSSTLDGKWYATCGGDQCSFVGHFDTEPEAIAAWNTRTAHALPGDVGMLRAELEWYGEQARLARLVHSGGDAGRYALADDGGKRARAALAEVGGRHD